MSSYNDIRKVKYTKNPSDPVALKEYIMFSDEKDKQKYIVFKFLNNLNQCLRAIKFEVKQFDKNNQLIEKSVLMYDNFVAEQNSPFVPNAKLKVNFSCESITVDTVFAVFDRVKWQGGEFTDNSYRFDRYASDVAAARVSAVKAKAAAPEKVNKKAEKVKVKKAKKQRFGAVEINRANIAVFPKVFNVLICILVIAWVAATLMYFKFNSNKITVDGYDLKIVSQTEADFIGYDGAEAELTVPAKVGDYNIVKINSGAFSNPALERVILDTRGSVTVEEGAFKNSNVVSVTSSQNAGNFTVMENAFEACLKLNTVNLPTATLFENSLNGCVNVKNLTFNGFASNRTEALAQLFNMQENQNISIDSLTCNISYAKASFLSGVTVKGVNFTNVSFTAEYGAFKDTGLCRFTESCEVLNGEVVSVNTNSDILEIPRYTQKFDADKFGALLQSFKKLSVQTLRSDSNPLKVDAELLKHFTSLSSLQIADEITEEGALSGCPSLKEFISPVLSQPIKNYLQGTAVSALGITGSGSLTYSYFGELKQITSLNVDTSIIRADVNAFSGLALEYLSIPNFANRRINEYSGVSALTEIELKPYSSNKTVPERCFAGLPLLKKITVAEGFTGCNKQIVYDAAALTKLVLPDTITSFTYPVIYTGCTSLADVTVSFPATAPATYSAFNNSFASTVNLSAGFSGLIPSGFFAGCKSIARLYLRCGFLGSMQEGLLSELNLGYLQIEADNVNVTLAKLLGSVSYVQTLIVESEVLPDEFFGGVTLHNALLKSIKKVTSKLFTGSKITSLYFTDSLVYDATLFTAIKDVTADFYFKGSRPQNSGILNATQNYRWNYDAEQELIYEF